MIDLDWINNKVLSPPYIGGVETLFCFMALKSAPGTLFYIYLLAADNINTGREGVGVAGNADTLQIVDFVRSVVVYADFFYAYSLGAYRKHCVSCRGEFYSVVCVECKGFFTKGGGVAFCVGYGEVVYGALMSCRSCIWRFLRRF